MKKEREINYKKYYKGKYIHVNVVPREVEDLKVKLFIYWYFIEAKELILS